MLYDTYDILWSKCVSPAAKEILHLCVDENNRYNVKMDETPETRKLVYDAYNKYRDDIHNNYFRGEKYDAHKMAACFAAAILEICPITFDVENKELPEYIGASNYWLSITSALYIVRLFLMSDYNRINRDSYIVKMKENLLKFNFPRTTPGHDLYLRGRVKVMVLNDQARRPFDLLAFADMLFWIELYNRQIYEGTISPMVIERLLMTKAQKKKQS